MATAPGDRIRRLASWVITVPPVTMDDTVLLAGCAATPDSATNNSRTAQIDFMARIVVACARSAQFPAPSPQPPAPSSQQPAPAASSQHPAPSSQLPNPD